MCQADRLCSLSENLQYRGDRDLTIEKQVARFVAESGRMSNDELRR